MTTLRLLLRTLTFHWRSNLAIVLGVIAGTAVIGGALVVGDSVRDSLRQMTLDRLGRIDHVLAGPRFFRQAIADELVQAGGFSERFESAAPVLTMRGAFVRSDEEGQVEARAGGVHVWGIEDRFLPLTDHGDAVTPTGDEVLLNGRVAEQLNVKVGDTVRLTLEIPQSIPTESLFGKRDESSREIPLVVKGILPDDLGLARFALDPSQQLPPNAFVALETLQQELDLSEVRGTRRNPDGRPARVNAVFVAARKPEDGAGYEAIDATGSLTKMLRRVWQPADFGLELRESDEHHYLTVESDRMVLEDAIAEAAVASAQETDWPTSPVLVYLGNELSNVKKPDALARYSVIAGVDLTNEPPFGGFAFIGDAPTLPLGEGEIESAGPGEIIINDWLANDLQIGVGDELQVTYHLVGSHGDLPEETVRFQVRGIVKLDGAAKDRRFTPEVKGITDVDSFDDWEKPFPMKEVTPRDDDYWTEYRATPKAFVSLKTARHLWKSRYGQQTSVRIAPPAETSLEEAKSAFREKLLANIEAERTGLAFRPVKIQGLMAASGTTDFSGLFIGFSFFLILSATILISLLFGLGIESRAGSMGLLSAIGLSPRQVQRLLFAEGFVLVAIGGAIGTLAAVGYASLMVYGLKTWWIGAIGTRFLEVSVHPMSLAIGLAISVIVAAVAIWWAVRRIRRISTRDLLAGATEIALTEALQQDRSRRSGRIALIAAAIAGVIVALAFVGAVPASEAFFGLSWQVVAFFLVGIALLVACLSFLSAWLDSDQSGAVRGQGLAGTTRLGMRNASRHRSRSVFTVGLIASATFVIVAVAAGRRNPAVETPQLDSGNGGFLLVAQTSKGILRDLNTEEGRNALNITFGGDEQDEELFAATTVMPFRVEPGEDASCLNLYQTRLPTILGVPHAMIERGGFKFANTPSAEPWSLLEAPQEDGTIPVLGDMNTLMYSLHKKVGDVIAVPDEENPEYRLKIMGMFDGSIFQGVLLMSEANFTRLYPDRDGYQYFLLANDALPDAASRQAAAKSASDLQTRIDKMIAQRTRLESAEPVDQEALANVERELTDARFESAHAERHALPPTEQLAALFESKLADYGFDAEPVARRLADFLAVQNTYLSTFQTLGGLGLLLGSIGLATVMLRNVLERRSELALLRAVGFRNDGLAVLVLAENAFLLLWGLAAGTVSALLAMTPHLQSTGADIPWTGGAAVLIGVFATGMLAALFAVADAVRTPIVATLRGE